MEYPYFIIISGPPASGKTTLGRKLKEHYNLPLLYKDLIKETLFDTLGIADAEWSGKLGYTSMVLLYKLLDVNLSAKKSIIFESAFLGNDESKKVQVIIEKYNAYPIEIYCTASDPVIIKRFMNREKSPERHKGHHRKNVLPDLEERLKNKAYNSLNLNEHVLTWNTDDFSKVSFLDLITNIEGLIKRN